MPKTYPIATHPHGSHVWILEPNDVWNLPIGIDDVRFECDTVERHGYQVVTHVSGLALDVETGVVYGWRKMTKTSELGTTAHGTLQIEGKKRKAFTSDALFQRPDGSLVSVAILYL